MSRTLLLPLLVLLGLVASVEDHEAHASTLEALRGRRLGLAGHAWFETYSVLIACRPGCAARRPMSFTC